MALMERQHAAKSSGTALPHGKSRASPARVDRSHDPARRLQQTIGNRALGRLIRAKLNVNSPLKNGDSPFRRFEITGEFAAQRGTVPLFQRAVSEPADACEQEADRVADLVMRTPDAAIAERAQVTATGEAAAIARACSACDEDPSRRVMREADRGVIQPRQAGSPGGVRDVPPAVVPQLDTLRGGGQPLSASTRAFFEPRFGHDFGDVRVHTDTRAVGLSQAIGAEAFTYGNDICFNDARFAPGSAGGNRLLAHELAHVVQARAMPSLVSLRRSAESEARRIENLLSYGVLDWAITDDDAVEALEILSNLPSHLQEAVVRRIDLGRLRENLPATHVPILDGILHEIGEPPRTVQETVARIQDLLSYGLFDWAITDREAREAFRLLTSLPAAEQERVVLVINYDRLLENLPDAADREALQKIRKPAVTRETSEVAAMDAFGRRADAIVTKIKGAADALVLPVPPAGGRFEQFVSNDYLAGYCPRPNTRGADTAIEQMTRVGSGGFTHYGFSLLRNMAERAHGQGIGYIDTPFLLGTPAPNVVTPTNAWNPWSQGPNPTQIMHFAGGIKWSWAPTAIVQWYFIQYEKVTAEGWQLFGLDSLNDVIAEEAGRLFAEALTSGRSCVGGQVDLDAFFAQGRAFLRGQLSESRLDTLARRVHLPNLVVETAAHGGSILSKPLYAMTIMEQLIAGASDAVVLASPDAGILIMLYHLLRRG